MTVNPTKGTVATVMKALVNVQGNISPPEDAKISVFDRGFLFGDGVYETGSSEQRRLLYLEEHLQRLRRSAAKLKLSVPWDDAFLTSELRKTAAQLGISECYFRIIVTRGQVEQVGLEEVSANPTRVMIVQELSPGFQKKRETGYHLLTSKVIRNATSAQDPDIKTSNYLNSLLALQDVKSRGGMDGVMCDAKGCVAEGTTFSVFAVGQDGVLRTPSLSVGILDSITRRHVLESAVGLCKVEEGSFPLAEFLDAKEVFIASSVRRICPVYQWDSKKFTLPGPMTQALNQKLCELAKTYIGSHDPF